MRESILVTGGAGFVGSSLSMLFKRDHPEIRVIAFDNLRRRGSELNLGRLKQMGVEFVHGDIRNPEDLEAIGDVGLLIDCAAEPSVLAGYGGSPSYVIRTNLDGTINCLEFARKHKSDVIFLSTSRVYPIKNLRKIRYQEDATRLKLEKNQDQVGASDLGIAETFSLDGTRSMYGTTKLASELVLAEYTEMYGIRSVVNRCGVLTGPWQMGQVDQGVIVLWLARHLFGGKLSYVGYGGHGKQVRDLLHVRDLYDLLNIQLSDISRHTGRTYNVGGGIAVSTSLLELTEKSRLLTGREIAIGSVAETRAADIPIYITDNSLITAATGWKPKISVDETLEEITDWLKDHRKILEPILI